MMKYLSIFLCLRYLSRKKIVLLSVAAVALSSALLITVASLFAGFIEALENGAGEHLGDIILASPGGDKISDYKGLIDALEENPAVESATAVLSSQGLLLLEKGDVRAVQIWGIELPRRLEIMPMGQVTGTQPELDVSGSGDTGQIPGYVGIGLVSKLDEETDEYDMVSVADVIGTNVVLTAGAAEKTGRPDGQSEEAGDKIRRKAFEFRITDVVFSGIYEFDQNFVYLPLDALGQKLYPGQGPIADTIQINLRENVDEQAGLAIVRGIWKDWAQEKLEWADYALIESSREMQKRLVAEYKKQMAMLMLIFGIVSGGIVLLVFCIFYMIVMTKRKDIAIIKSCGAGWTSAGGIFLGFGLVTGVAGAALGIVLGYIITININTVEQWISVAFGLKIWKASTYMFSRIPSEVDWQAAMWISIAAVAAAVAGALIPAINAAGVKPVKILRYE